MTADLIYNPRAILFDKLAMRLKNVLFGQIAPLIHVYLPSVDEEFCLFVYLFLSAWGHVCKNSTSRLEDIF